MKKVLYLLLAITLLITAIGVVKITPLLSDNINNSTKGNLIISSSSMERPNSPDINMKTQSTQGMGYNSFLTSLPCFKCHEIDDWKGNGEGNVGGWQFPHAFHIEMELHCLDCHTFIAHGEGMTVAVETCSRCHE